MTAALRIQKLLQHTLTFYKQHTLHCNNKKDYIHFWTISNETPFKNLHTQIKEDKHLETELNKDKVYLSNILLVKNKNNNNYYSTQTIMNMFNKWLNTAFKYSPMFIKFPNAVCLSTIDENNFPSSRYVILRTIEMNNGKFIFFTNLNSNKAKQLTIKPNASMVFYWDVLNVSVRIKGIITKSDSDLNTKYWTKRPKQSKLCDIVCNQSQQIYSLEELRIKYKNLQHKYKNVESKDISKPNNWGGFALTAQKIEFWSGQRDRFHHRIVFTKQINDQWKATRLQP
eukprot:375480_1